MNHFSKKEIILLFAFVLLLLITWPKQGRAGTTYTQACQTAGACSCFGGSSASCTTDAQCLNNLCSYSCPAAGANSSLSSNSCSPGTSNNCNCWETMGYCYGGKTCSCTISGNCNYTCNAGWQDANNNPSDGCEAPTGTCTDPDGRNFNTYGCCTNAAGVTYCDYCDFTNPNIAYDYYCSGSWCIRDSTTCTYGCSGGKCNPPPATYTLTIETRVDIIDTALSGVQITVDGNTKNTDASGYTTYSLTAGSHTISAQNPVGTRPFSHFWDHDANVDCTQNDPRDTANNPYTFTMAACNRTITAWYKVFTHFQNSIGAVGAIDFNGSKISGYLLNENNNPLHYPAGATVSLSYYDGSSWQPIGSATAQAANGYFEYSWSCVAGATKVKAEFTDSSWYYTSSSGEKSVSCPSLCTRKDPEVTIPDSPKSGAAGTELTYTVNVKNADVGAGCVASVFALNVISCPPEMTYCTLDAPTNLTLSPGETGSTVLRVKSSLTATPGQSYSISVQATNTSVPPPSPNGTGTATYTVSAAPCTRAKPTVTLFPSPQTGNPGDTRIYTISIKNNDTLGCDNASFALSPSCPSGWNCVPNKLLVLPVPPQTTDSSANISVTSPTTATPGDYTISVTVVHSKAGPGFEETGTAIYTVLIAPCVRAIPEVTFNPPSQTGNPGDLKIYTINIKNNDSIGCDNALFVLSVTSCPSGWSCSLSKIQVLPVAPQTTDSSASLKVTSSSTASPEDYPIEIKVVHSKAGPGYEIFASAEYIISYACPPEVCQNLLNLVKSSFGRTCASSDYNPVADINKDGKIEITDLGEVGKHCGDGDWCQNALNDTSNPCCDVLRKKINDSMLKTCADIGEYDPVADVNKDGEIDIRDLAMYAKMSPPECQAALGNTFNPCCKVLLNLISSLLEKTCKNPEYNPVADVNKDGKIEGLDLAATAKLTPPQCQSALADTYNPCLAPFCGNGTKEGSEDCDGFDFGNENCATIGFLGGKLTCTTDCKYNTSECIRPVILVPCGPGLAGGLIPCGRSCDVIGTPERENCPCTLCHFFILGDRIVKFALLNIVFPLAVLMIVIGGVIFLTAGGSPGQIATGKRLMIATVIGLVIIFTAWIIVNTIFMFIGVADWTGLKEGWWKITCNVPTESNDSNGDCRIDGGTCSDPDGVDVTTASTCTNPDGTQVRDECYDDTHVFEYICPVNGYCSANPVPCPSSQYCKNGACTTCSSFTKKEDCEPDCKWCPQCDNYRVNTWKADACVDLGTNCGYHCEKGVCGAACVVDKDCGGPYGCWDDCRCHYECLAEKSLILTPNGFRKIEDLREGDYVIGYKDGKKVESKILEKSIHEGEFKLYLYKDYWFTGNHLVYLDDHKEFKRVDELSNITRHYKGKVYNIQTETQNYFGENGLLIHNK